MLESNIVAVCNLVEANNSGTTGLLLLVQRGTSSEVSIRGRISTLTAGSHGFHVHTVGATGNNCDDAGSTHFNPTNVSSNKDITRNFIKGFVLFKLEYPNSNSIYVLNTFS